MVSINYDKRVDKLIEKYYLTNKDIHLSDAEIKILKVWETINSSHRVAIWGAGEHSADLLEFIPLGSKNLVCFIDKAPEKLGSKLKGVPILPPSAIDQENIDTVVISSFAYRNDIYDEIKANYNCDAVDLYAGIHDNYTRIYDRKFHNIYKKICLLKRDYSLSNHTGYLKELITIFLQIRDFSSSIYYINSYINKKHTGYADLAAFLDELKSLLNSFRSDLQQRNNQDLIMLIMDSLRYKDTIEEQNDLPFFKEMMGKAVTFSNAYSNSTYTRASFFSLYNDKHIIDDQLVNTNSIVLEENKFLVDLINKGYYVVQYGGIVIKVKDEMNNNNFRLDLKEGRNAYEPLSLKIWKTLCSLIEKPQQAVCSIIHAMETHWPFSNGLHNTYIDFREHPAKACYKWLAQDKLPIDDLKQANREAIQYVDQQLNYYKDFFPPDITLSMLGDHGHALGEHNAFFNVLTWYDEVLHVPIIIYNPGFRPEVISDLTSLEDFKYQLLHLIENKETKQIKRDFVYIQRDPIYHPHFVHDHGFRHLLGEKFMRGYKAIRTNTEKYILYDDGKEEYFLLPDEETDHIHNMTYKDRIETIKSRYLTNKEFPYLSQSNSTASE